MKPAIGMMGAGLIGAVVAAGAMTLWHPGSAAGGDGVRSYLLDHPEVIPEAMDRLQAKQNAALVDANRAAISTPFAGAVAGNPRAAVTVTEYYDYACGYCRASVADVDRLAHDPDVRLVFKEMPVLSPLSDRAARVSLVAAKAGPGAFAAFHHAIYAAGQLDEATLAAAAKGAGIDPAGAAAPDIDREVQTTMGTVRALRMTGTPTFVIGDQILAGAIGYAGLRAAVDAAKTTG